MFESVNATRTINSKDFEKRALQLRQDLLVAQRAIAQLKRPVVIIVAGLEGAGKGSAVHRLNEWMDARYIDTHAFMQPSDEEESRPFYWRFWRNMPDKGNMGIFFGSWYTEPIKAALRGDISKKELAAQGAQITQFEQMLCEDGALIIKLWFHLSSKTQYKQLADKMPHREKNLTVPANAKLAKANYRKTLQIAEKLILKTDSDSRAWHIVLAEDKNVRDITVGECVLQSLTAFLERAAGEKQETPPSTLANMAHNKALATVNLQQTMSKKDYRRKLKKQQRKLQELAWQFYDQKRSVVAVFEGWDAAGKGSAIRRVTSAVDPRLYKLLQFAAPTDEECRQHYLWRFWRRLERDGRSTLFDRSWYGRVLVERVESFATPQQWQRSYEEINQFEQQLTDHGTTVLKFWLHISPEEQLRRFEQRQKQPHKQYKITEEDWRNREKWQAYEQAVEDMIQLTSTQTAPWTLVAGNDKRSARIQVLKTFCKSMERTLNKG